MSDFLFAHSSIWVGLGRIIDMGDTLTEFNSSTSGAQADRIALEQDWLAVGRELRQAMRRFSEANKEDLVAGGA